jgi:rhodanese-related sulfurtransferase
MTTAPSMPVFRPSKRRFALPMVVLALAALVGGAGGGCTKDYSDKDIEEISLSQVRTLTGGKDAPKVMLVDPRAESDFAAGHLPGAQNLGLNSERARTGEGLNPVFKGYKHIVVYGDDPSSAPAIAMTKRLMTAGAKGVKLFRGGLIEWRRAGLPIEKDAAASVGDEAKKAGTLAK